MPRLIWKGAVGFSLIPIPVSLHSASREESLDFSLLDRRDFAPIAYERSNRNTGKPVEWGDLIEGCQYAEGEYGVMSAEKPSEIRATEVVHLSELLKRSFAERKGAAADRAAPAATFLSRIGGPSSSGTRRRRA